MEHGAPLQRRTTLSSYNRSAASVRRAGPMCPAAAHAFSAGHAGPALQGTGRVRADRVVRPYEAVIGGVPCGTSYPKGICSAALHCGTPSPTSGSPYPSVGRDPCVPPHDMHVFLPAGHAGPALQGTGRIRADRVVRPYDGVPCVRRGGLTMAGHKRCAFIVPSGAPAAPYK